MIATPSLRTALIQEKAEALYMIYAADHPNELPATIREWARREAEYLIDERDAIQNEGTNAK